MTPPFILRPGRAADQPQLLAIVWATVLDNESDRDEMLARPELVRVPVEEVNEDTCAVAEMDGGPVGFAVVLPRTDGNAELEGLFVHPNKQRLGIGRELVAAGAELARAMGADVLYVVANDDAVALYQSIGFVQTGMVLTDLRTAPRMELTLGRE